MQTINYKGFVVTLSDEDTKKLNKAWDGASKHWTCIVYDKPNRKQMSFDIFGGSMATMQPLEALYCFTNDAMDYLNFNDAYELMKDFGYDDYKEAKRVFNAFQKAYFKCRKFIGSDSDINEIVEELREEWG